MPRIQLKEDVRDVRVEDITNLSTPVNLIVTPPTGFLSLLSTDVLRDFIVSSVPSTEPIEQDILELQGDVAENSSQIQSNNSAILNALNSMMMYSSGYYSGLKSGVFSASLTSEYSAGRPTTPKLIIMVSTLNAFMIWFNGIPWGSFYKIAASEIVAFAGIISTFNTTSISFNSSNLPSQFNNASATVRIFVLGRKTFIGE